MHRFGEATRRVRIRRFASNASSYRVLVLGGGAGGQAVSSALSRRLGKGAVGVVEPASVHYYQPMWTFVGAGAKRFEESRKDMSDVMSSGVDWIKTAVTQFEPEKNRVATQDGKTISYEYLVVALGIQLDFHKVKGLAECVGKDGVSSNYSANTVRMTWKFLEDFKGGEALFTFPNTPIKCAGAPQKIMYLADDLWRKKGMRGNVNISYYSSLPVIFGAKKYAATLNQVAKCKDVNLNFRHNLVEVKGKSKEAIFENLDTQEKKTVKYDFMHVTPPMSPPDILKGSPLSDAVGWVDVDKETLQHKKYPNVFGIGDCTNVPTSKTAAAVAGQSGVLRENLLAAMRGQALTQKYDGYTSCPLPTSYGKLVLAEFDFNGEPLETFPVNQGKERRPFYFMKKDMMPFLYWNLLLKGRWKGPKMMRTLAHLGMNKR
ncbi:sulfide:quinone oxidoreductase, mitochondrial-like isoform X3 [Oscarella lobularis]|uniref:sulfide:quinone oxidoreductase, mitochondrial-like isoform X3 n=1 Tax=Oscarella lobularis TaxID=121494 RepID=UPI003313835A